MRSFCRWMLILLALLLTVGGIWLLWYSGFFQALSSVEGLKDYIAQFSPYSHLGFFLLQLLSVILAPIPSNVTALAGGLLLSTWPAFFLTFLGVALGSFVVFGVARWLGRERVLSFLGHHLSQKYFNLILSRTSVFLSLAFLFPFFPDDLLCVFAGLSAITWKRFILIVLLTRPWGLWVASALGGISLHLSQGQFLLLLTLGGSLFLLGLIWGPRLEQWVIDRFHSQKSS